MKKSLVIGMTAAVMAASMGTVSFAEDGGYKIAMIYQDLSG